MKNLRINLRLRPYILRVKRGAALALMLLWFTSGLALPTHYRIHQASDQTTTQPAMKKGWVFSGDLNKPRYRHTATLLENGKVLVAGGGVGPYCDCCCAPNPDSRITDSAELYDPAAKKWSNTGSLNTARFRHSATLLENGQVLVTGGHADVYFVGGLPLTSAELYDPATGGWLFTGSFKTIQGSHSATMLPNGNVLAVGYSNDFGHTAEIYDPATGTWSQTDSPNFGGGVDSTILLPNGKVLVTGLSNGYPSPLRAELFDLNTGMWTAAGSPRAALFWPSYQATLLPNGQVLVAGGYSSHSRPNGEELYDPATGRWDFTSRLNLARHFSTATLLPNGSVLVAGGVDEGTDQQALPYSETELYDSATGSIAIPTITGASISGKKLFVVGENFDLGAVIVINGKEKKTKNASQNFETTLIAKKAGKKIKPGDKIQVRNPNGTMSVEFTFTG